MSRKINPVSVEKNPDGSYTVYQIKHGHLDHVQYYGYPKKTAVRMFKARNAQERKSLREVRKMREIS
jgi:hypothetical protein